MRVAFVIGRFPSVSETFILNQIAGVLRHGIEVEIHAVRPAGDMPVHPLVKECGLMDFVQYRPVSSAKSFCRFRRVLLSLWVLLLNSGRLKMMLHVFRAGRNDPGACTLTYLSLAHSLLRSKADIVHAQYGHSGRHIAELKRIGLVPQPLVVSLRGGDSTINKEDNAVRFEQMYRQAERFLPVSRQLADLHEKAGCESEKIEVHHSGIMLDHFLFRPFAGFRHPLRLLTVGRMVEKKGHQYAVDAVRMLLQQGVDVRLTLVGDGPLEDQIRRRAEDVIDFVQFVGWKPQNEVLDLICESDLLLAPCVTAENGDQEGIPNFVKEAMACGIPVASTDHAGIPELVEDGVSGFLVPERDVEALTGSVVHMMKNPEIIPAMIEAARETVEDEFNIEKLNGRLVEVYQEVLNHRA